MQAAVIPQQNSFSEAQAQALEITALKQQIQTLQQQLDWFKKQLFGVKSEKRLIDAPGQLGLLEGAAPPATEIPTETIRTTRRKAKVRGADCVTDEGLRFDASVPVEVIHLGAPELEGPQADQYEVIDEKVTRRLAQRPGSYVVLEYRRPVLKHRPSGSLTTATAPPAVLEKCLADVSVLAGLLVDKFCYHLPLYRQHQRLADGGITLSRTTLTTWAQRTVDLLRPIYDAQFENLLRSRVLAMDETPIKAGRKKKGRMRQGWLWPVYGLDDEIGFSYASTRGSAHLEGLLKGFEGVLLTDGYAAYDRYAKNRPEITQAQCWAHTRRYFVKATAIEPAAVGEALEQIGALYAIEKTLRERRLEGEKKQRYRARHAMPRVEAFFGWCREQRGRPDLVNSNPLAKALVYADNRREQLRVYLSDPDVPIDTNHVERNLRAIPMGRKNWMFCWTEIGAEHVGVIQSLLTTCRLQGVDPYTYLVDVLQRVSRHPAKDVADLTPRLWKDKFASAPLRSDLAQ